VNGFLVIVGGGWGAIVAWPLVGLVRRQIVADRFPSARPVRRRPHAGPVGRVLRGVRAARARRRESEALERDLPAALDLLLVAVGAGAPPRGAVQIAATWAPPRIAARLQSVLNATELGGSLADALAELADAAPAFAPVADVLIASARLGAPASGALTRLADEARAAARRRAEARARVLPVKLLFPLVFLVLPAFGLLTVAPALISAMSHL
jgi:tight adherence protein C